MKKTPAFVALAVAAIVTACNGPAAAAPAGLTNSEASRDALIDGVLYALAAEDEAALTSLLATRADWEDLLWPEMPDKETTPFEFIYGLSADNSRKGRTQALARYGGTAFEFVSVSFTKDPEVYPSFTLHKGAQVVVRNPETGEQGVLPVFDVFVEYAGGWKLLNFDEL